MRRSLAIARYLFPDHIEVVPCPANDTNTRRDNWMNTPAGRERTKGEAMKLVRYVIEGVIPDFEIWYCWNNEVYKVNTMDTVSIQKVDRNTGFSI